MAELSGRDRVLTFSGLTPWTQAGKHAFGMAFLHEAAEQAGKSGDQMHPAFRSTFQQYGFTERDWDSLRRRPIRTRLPPCSAPSRRRPTRRLSN